MASLQSFLLNGISGKVGDLVYYQMNGKTYVRSAPQPRTVPPTPLQLRQRERFLTIVRYCQKFRYSVIPRIWNGRAKSTSGFSLFMKTNSHVFLPDGSLSDVKALCLSSGQLFLPQGLTVQRNEDDPTFVDITWEKDAHLGGLPLWDELLCISTGGDLYSGIMQTGFKRGDLKACFELPVLDVPATHLFLFFGSYDKKKYTESVCFEI